MFIFSETEWYDSELQEALYDLQEKKGLANARPAVIWPYGTAYLFLAISSLPSTGFSALGKLVAHVQSHVRSGEHTLLEANTHINTRIRTHDKHILLPT